jgi:hypothetical protein
MRWIPPPVDLAYSDAFQRGNHSTNPWLRSRNFVIISTI